MKLEVCVDNIRSVRNAFEGGADRIELCSALSEGGLTPSLGFLRATRQATSPTFPIFTMIRPRGGNFNYDDTEIEIMVDDIRNLKEGGADGFVFGILTDDKTVDTEKCKKLLEVASPLPTTFHRAFDEVTRPEEEIEKIIILGFNRLLTSGLSSTADEGKETIYNFCALSRGRLIVMAGAGICPDNLESILLTTRVTEFHGSAKGVSPNDGYALAVTSRDVVRSMKRIASNLRLT